MSDAADDSLIKVPDLPIRLPVFEGPDLLYLIRRNEVDIYDIPISEVTVHVYFAQDGAANPEVAEFFVMASTYVYKKPHALAPK